MHFLTYAGAFFGLSCIVCVPLREMGHSPPNGAFVLLQSSSFLSFAILILLRFVVRKVLNQFLIQKSRVASSVIKVLR